MTPRIPSMTVEAVVRILKLHHFRKTRQKGSHATYRHADGRTTVVPIHPGEDIGPGLLRRILKDAGLDPNDLRE